MAEVTLYDTGDPVKFCRKCKKHKSFDEFKAYFTKRGTRKVSSPCKECGEKYRNQPHRKERTAKWVKEYNKTPKGRRHVKNMNARRFGITVDDFDRMKTEQNNLCAICGKQERTCDWRSGQQRDLAIDHDHVSGRVRELLCGDCNRMIGLAKEDSARLRSAADYLDKHAAKN